MSYSFMCSILKRKKLTENITNVREFDWNRCCFFLLSSIYSFLVHFCFFRHLFFTSSLFFGVVHMGRETHDIICIGWEKTALSLLVFVWFARAFFWLFLHVFFRGCKVCCYNRFFYARHLFNWRFLPFDLDFVCRVSSCTWQIRCIALESGSTLIPLWMHCIKNVAPLWKFVTIE